MATAKEEANANAQANTASDVESGFGLRQYLRQAARLDDVSESTFRQLRNKKMEAEAEIAALKLALYQRKLHRTEDVEFLMTTMLTAVKSRLLAIPSRTTRLVLGKTGFQEVYSLLYSELEQVLRTLSAYNPSDFAEQNEEYLASVDAALAQPNGNGEKLNERVSS